MFFPQILFASVIAANICLIVKSIKFVNDIWVIPCQYELPLLQYGLVQFALLDDTKDHSTRWRSIIRKQCLFLILMCHNFLYSEAISNFANQRKKYNNYDSDDNVSSAYSV